MISHHLFPRRIFGFALALLILAVGAFAFGSNPAVQPVAANNDGTVYDGPLDCADDLGGSLPAHTRLKGNLYVTQPGCDIYGFIDGNVLVGAGAAVTFKARSFVKGNTELNGAGSKAFVEKRAYILGNAVCKGADSAFGFEGNPQTALGGKLDCH